MNFSVDKIQTNVFWEPITVTMLHPVRIPVGHSFVNVKMVGLEMDKHVPVRLIKS